MEHFNSHPRVGGDMPVIGGTFVELILIRTPAWGVTFGWKDDGWLDIFQFAPPRGG